MKRRPIGVDDATEIQPCPHCNHAVTVVQGKVEKPEFVQTFPRDKLVFAPYFPKGLKPGQFYRVLCDDKGRNGGTWLQVMISPADGDVHVSMQDWENRPDGEPWPFPSLRARTAASGGRNDRTRQALLWLAEAIRLDTEDRTHHPAPGYLGDVNGLGADPDTP
jgi:hypothetical protein